MPRPERPLSPITEPVHAFAAELRLAREKAGNPKYLQMARATGRSRTALSEAAGGDHLPTWETVEAYLIACGQKPTAWRGRWDAVRMQLDQAQIGRPTVSQVAQATSGMAKQSAVVTTARRSWWLAAAGAAVIFSALLAAFFGYITGHKAGQAQQPLTVGSSGPVVIIVQNKVAIGASTLIEDTSPAYLSTRTEPACSHHDCEIRGTEMWSGQVLQALCQKSGTVMTNEDLASPGIMRNPGGITSSLWYRAETSNGVIGYISEVYLAPSSRGGLKLPPCPIS
jgi:hypothetical protein